MEINVAVRSETGPVREENQDHYLVSDLRERMVPHDGERIRIDPEDRSVVLAVADGMGGHLGGRQAAELALSSTLSRLTRAYPWRKPSFLSDAIEAANAAVHERAGSDARFAGMGTTLTAAALAGNGLFLGHVGDSRAYLFRDGKLERLTTEHSFLVKVLGKDPDEARSHAKGNVLANVVGGKEPEVSVELSYLPLRSGDLLLLCSDGLWGVVPDAAIGAALAEPKLERACAALIEAAIAHKTTDNVTVLLARFEGDELAGPGADPASCALKRLVEVEWDQEAERMGTVLRERPPWPPRRPLSPRTLGLSALVFLAFFLGGAKLVPKLFPPTESDPVPRPRLVPAPRAEGLDLPPGVSTATAVVPGPGSGARPPGAPGGGTQTGQAQAAPSHTGQNKGTEPKRPPEKGPTLPAGAAQDGKRGGAAKPAEVAQSTAAAKPAASKQPPGAKEPADEKAAGDKKPVDGKGTEPEKPKSGRAPARRTPPRPGPGEDEKLEIDVFAPLEKRK